MNKIREWGFLVGILVSACTKLPSNHLMTKNSGPYLLDVKNEISSVIVELKYLGEDNFLGVVVDGYKKNICYLSHPAIESLKIIQRKLLDQKKSLKFFDCYRPQQAVEHFWRWALDANDLKNQKKYYPHILPKEKLFDGYIARKSGHSRGSTIDIMIVDSETHQELDMGSIADLLDPISHTNQTSIGKEAQMNRAFIKKIMEDNGWYNYPNEWWHYTLKNEPFPKTYFDFPVD